jgi:hypothetical protein
MDDAVVVSEDKIEEWTKGGSEWVGQNQHLCGQRCVLTTTLWVLLQNGIIFSCVDWNLLLRMRKGKILIMCSATSKFCLYCLEIW